MSLEQEKELFITKLQEKLMLDIIQQFEHLTFNQKDKLLTCLVLKFNKSLS